MLSDNPRHLSADWFRNNFRERRSPVHIAEHKHCSDEIHWPGCRDYTPVCGNLRKGSAIEAATQPDQSLAVPWDTELQLLSKPLCHPLPLQLYIPLTGSALTDDN